MVERRPRFVPVRMHDTHTANTTVSICQYILLRNIYIYEDDLQLGKLKENCWPLKLKRIYIYTRNICMQQTPRPSLRYLCM